MVVEDDARAREILGQLLKYFGANAPFVAVTAYDFEERTVRAQGFSALLRKPLRGEPLLAAVTTAAIRR